MIYNFKEAGLIVDIACISMRVILNKKIKLICNEKNTKKYFLPK